MMFSSLSGYHVDVHATSTIADDFIENGNTEDGGTISQNTWTDVAQSATEGTDFTTDGTTSASPSTYVVKTAKRLAWIADQVNNNNNAFWDCTVRLDTDIDLADGTLEDYLKHGAVSWTPIGSANLPFMGTFDGNHKTISGIFITDISDGQGLFGSVIGGTIKNVNITNISIHTSSPIIGGIVGLGTDVTITGCTNFTTITGISYAGGIIGNIQSNSTTPTSIVSTNMIKDCYTTGPVTTANNLGAVIGYCYDNALTISNCYYNTDKTGTTPTPDQTEEEDNSFNIELLIEGNGTITPNGD